MDTAIFKKASAAAVSTALALMSIPVLPTAIAADNVQEGVIDGYSWHMYNADDQGTVSMEPGAGGTFQCSWSDIRSADFSSGHKFEEKLSWADCYTLDCIYDVDFQTNGNAYLEYTGMMDCGERSSGEHVFTEFHIVEDHGTWMPPGYGCEELGSRIINGRLYDIYVGTALSAAEMPLYEVWSVCKNVRTDSSATVSINEHISAWELWDVPVGDISSILLNIEAFECSGNAAVISNELVISKESDTDGEDIIKPVCDRRGRYVRETFSDKNNAESWTNKGNCVIDISEGVLKTTNRSKPSDGPTIALNEAASVPERSYAYDVDIYQDSEDSELFFFVIEYRLPGIDEPFSVEIAKTEVPKGEWTYLTAYSFTVPDNASDLKLSVETDSSSCDFIIDDLTVALSETILEHSPYYKHGYTPDGYSWYSSNQYNEGSDSLTPGKNGCFKYEWDSTQFSMCCVGKKFDETLDRRSLKNIICEFAFDLQTDGNARAEITGAFYEPNMIFHICETYGTGDVPGNGFDLMGKKTIGDAEYTFYRSKITSPVIPVELPVEVYAVRSEEKMRSMGTLELTEFFDAFEDICMIRLTSLYSVSTGVECWKSSGAFSVTKNDITIVSDEISTDPTDAAQLHTGDLNRDGIVDAFDLILEKQAVIISVEGAKLAPDPAADIDKDGNIGINDLVLLTKYLLGEIRSFS